MNHTTRAQRINARYDKIWEQAKNTDTRFTAEGRELSDLCALNSELVNALRDAEFLMRQAGKIPSPMQDSFNRSSEDARNVLAKAKRSITKATQ